MCKFPLVTVVHCECGAHVHEVEKMGKNYFGCPACGAQVNPKLINQKGAK